MCRAHQGLIACAALALALVSGSALGHEPSAGPPSVVPPAPGYSELGFAAPAPGSYALPPLGPAADGRVLESDGSATTLHRVFGDHATLLSFVYASCADPNGCPLATAVLQRVKSRLEQEPELAARVRLVSLSFDPERDTPAAMRRYGEPFARSTLDWRFLTTRGEEDLAPILEAYGQAVVRERGPAGETTGVLAHLLRVFLVDAGKRVRNVYTVSFLHADTLVADLRTLLAESEEPSLALQTPQLPPAEDGDARLGSGDVREGYERRDYRTRSRALRARTGEPVDLFERLGHPPLGLADVPVPPDNLPSRERIALGRKLFFDRRLSHNGTLSCALCHVPEQGFASNEMATAVGIEGRSVRRNAPTLYNVAYVEQLFHDGRETSLEQQIWGPLLARNEMGNPSVGSLIARLDALPEYRDAFARVFPGRGLGMETLGMAIASYERALVSGESPFDRWRYAGEKDAIDASAKRGFELFSGRAGCIGCHPVGSETSLFSDGAFHNTGIGFRASMGRPEAKRRIQVTPGRWIEVEGALVDAVSEPASPDLGRYEISRDPADRWKYRTPGLRNVALTAPYMHDGSLGSLEEVVEFYDAGGVPNAGLDPRIRPLALAESERADLVAFLESLTGSDVSRLVADAFAAPIGDSR